MGKYPVKKHDTLTHIAQLTGSTIKIIMANNPIITDKNKIREGWVLEIPGYNDPVSVDPPAKPSINGAIAEAFVKCVNKICTLDEFKVLEEMINGDAN